MNATMARILSRINKRKTNLSYIQVKKAFEVISIACKHGRRSTTLTWDVPFHVVETLRLKGFKVTVNERSGNYAHVEW